LTGPDLWSLAEREGATPRVQKGITEGILFAAQLHRVDPAALPDLVVHDYANDPYLPAPAELHDRLNQRRRTIVLGGLEVRNFKQDRADGQWLFFDPHEAVIGAPEEDFTRYILSLLMINWGRHADCRIWSHFDYPQLLKIYETGRGAPLDRGLLAYMFRRNTAERRFRAGRAMRKLPWLMRGGARAYERLFFWQVRRWAGRHGL